MLATTMLTENATKGSLAALARGLEATACFVFFLFVCFFDMPHQRLIGQKLSLIY